MRFNSIDSGRQYILTNKASYIIIYTSSSWDVYFIGGSGSSKESLRLTPVLETLKSADVFNWELIDRDFSIREDPIEFLAVADRDCVLSSRSGEVKSNDSAGVLVLLVRGLITELYLK